MTPKTVKIGPLRHRVVVNKAALNKREVEAKEQLCGDYDNAGLTITLDPDMAPDRLAATLLHEIQHAILDITGASGDLSSEQLERICDANGAMWLAVIRDNPKLIDYLRERGT